MSHVDPAANGICALCGCTGPLRRSHIVSGFVYDWLKETSATGTIRTSRTPNRGVQDGEKRWLLGNECEGLLGQWEKLVAERIFRPFHEGVPGPLPYGPWLLKFAVSISWRVLTTYRLEGLPNDFPPRLVPTVEEALVTWREFLLDRRSDAGRFEQHLIPLGPVTADQIDAETPPNMNWFLHRSIARYMRYNATAAFVAAKVCQLLLVGTIEMPGVARWQGSRLDVNGGKFPAPHYVLPKWIPQLLMESARESRQRHQTLSPAQWEKIAARYRKDPDRAVRSETLRAIQYDVELFGEGALPKK